MLLHHGGPVVPYALGTTGQRPGYATQHPTERGFILCTYNPVGRQTILLWV